MTAATVPAINSTAKINAISLLSLVPTIEPSSSCDITARHLPALVRWEDIKLFLRHLKKDLPLTTHRFIAKNINYSAKSIRSAVNGANGITPRDNPFTRRNNSAPFTSP